MSKNPCSISEDIDVEPISDQEADKSALMGGYKTVLSVIRDRIR